MDLKLSQIVILAVTLFLVKISIADSLMSKNTPEEAVPIHMQN